LTKPPFTKRELEDRLDDMLFTVLSSRRTAAGVAAGLAPLTRLQQEFVLHWVHVAAQNTGELGYQVASQAPQAFTLFDRASMERWVLDALDVYDREGLHAASAALKDFNALRRRVDDERSAVALTEVARTLELFLRGLSGRALGVEPAETAWTDTETVFLPERIGSLQGREENRRLYTASAAFLWGQARYGTFNTDLDEAVSFVADRKSVV
jgi:nitric oxide reductase NorD protein